MRIGYARVSTSEQNIDLQIDALTRAGCESIFEDCLSGVKNDRPGLSEALAALVEGDTLVVWRLDRLARSMRDLTDTVTALHERQIGFQSICEHIDVSSAYGEFILHILSAVAHFERGLIVERTKAGMASAKARGARFGRIPVVDSKLIEVAQNAIDQGQSVADVASDLNVGRSTLYRHLAKLRTQRNSSARTQLSWTPDVALAPCK